MWQGTAFRRREDGTIEPLLRIDAVLVITTADTRYDPRAGDELGRFCRDVALASTGVGEGRSDRRPPHRGRRRRAGPLRAGADGGATGAVGSAG